MKFINLEDEFSSPISLLPPLPWRILSSPFLEAVMLS
jgi:hypothetical protein